MDNQNIKKVITHSSRFHADDVCAVATIAIVLGGLQNITIERTRNEAAFAGGDFVIDIGGEYDPARNRFDHHQKGGAGVRENKIPYASFGLVWKTYGVAACEACGVPKSISAEVADIIEKRFVTSVDAMDNGIDIFDAKNGAVPFILQDIVFSMSRTWLEDENDQDKAFADMVVMGKTIIERQIAQVYAATLARHDIETLYKTMADPRVLILDKHYPWDFLVQDLKELLFVVYPAPQDGTWKVGTVRDSFTSYSTRKPFPQSWAGLRDADLAKATGVPDATFCHNGLFLAVAKSKEGALKLAELALNAN